MKRAAAIVLWAALLLTAGCSKVIPPDVSEVSIVPVPMRVEKRDGFFVLDGKTTIQTEAGSPEAAAVGRYLAETVKKAAGFEISVVESDTAPAKKGAIVLTLSSAAGVSNAEGYELTVAETGAAIGASSAAGLFYGVQTVLQLLPDGIHGRGAVDSGAALAIPCVHILDEPRFPWRGMHLDVSRHFFPVETVRQFIDLLAMHKMNVFHWHLVDGTGWRIEIKRYPRLTDVAAWRVDIRDEPWDFTKIRLPEPDDTRKPYGGFYTHEDIREIVRYAAERHITVVPEIEMPGHSQAALAAYPEYLCTGAPETAREFKNSGVFCAGKEETFAFLEGVLDEVIELFPCEYVHIGGDEVPKRFWEACPDCQERIKKEKLADEDELQSYFIRRIETFLVSRGKKLVGWDEILEGGLAPEATVMSWRGTSGGIEAARQKHDVVMTPMSHCYFNLYQGDPELEPKAWGGYIPLNKVYSYDPVPEDLTADEASHILGAQGCVWTEYIQTPEMVEYMILPRMSALAEVVWTDKGRRDWDGFKTRMIKQYRRFGAMDVAFAKSAYNITFDIALDETSFDAAVTMNTDAAGADINYTLDGGEPTAASSRYSTPVRLAETAVITAGTFADGVPAGKFSSVGYTRHKATGKRPKLAHGYSTSYPGSGDFTLTNCLSGSKDYGDGQWQGYLGVDLLAVIDLGETATVSRIASSYFHNPGVWIFMPSSVEYALSGDGSGFTVVADIANDTPQQTTGPYIKTFDGSFDATRARFVRVHAKSLGVCPDWHVGAGGAAFMFADEIVVE